MVYILSSYPLEAEKAIDKSLALSAVLALCRRISSYSMI